LEDGLENPLAGQVQRWKADEHQKMKAGMYNRELEE
jgi:hypothetical protein